MDCQLQRGFRFRSGEQSGGSRELAKRHRIQLLIDHQFDGRAVGCNDFDRNGHRCVPPATGLGPSFGLAGLVDVVCLEGPGLVNEAGIDLKNEVVFARREVSENSAADRPRTGPA